jgi:urea transport system permease protein
VSEATALQIFSVVGAEDWPWMWAFSDSLFLSLLLVVLVPGLLALVFGWLAFRSRVTGVYLSILTQAMTLALSLYLFQNDTGLGATTACRACRTSPGPNPSARTACRSGSSGPRRWRWGWAMSARPGWCRASSATSCAASATTRRVRFLGYPVEVYKLVVFTLSAMICGVAGALYYPQAGIINPDEIAPIASIYLAVWVAIGGRGRLYGAVIGAAVVSLLSTWFTGGRRARRGPRFLRIDWIDWWPVLLGLGFVLVTLFAPKGIGGLFDYLVRKEDT